MINILKKTIDFFKSKDYYEIANFLSINECSVIIAEIEKHNFRQAQQFNDGRHNKEIFISSDFIESILENKFKGIKINFYAKPFEFYKYEIGDYITQHTDSSVMIQSNLSNYTALIYLNDNYAGGSTNLLSKKIKIKPEIGKLLLFKHNIVHEALPIVLGTKYIYRTNCVIKNSL